MAHFFFHVTSHSEVLVDRSGYDLLDLGEARDRALCVMRRCIETGIVQGDWRDWHLHVTDAEDEEVFAAPFADMIGRLH